MKRGGGGERNNATTSKMNEACSRFASSNFYFQVEGDQQPKSRRRLNNFGHYLTEKSKVLHNALGGFQEASDAQKKTKIKSKKQECLFSV